MRFLVFPLAIILFCSCSTPKPQGADHSKDKYFYRVSYYVYFNNGTTNFRVADVGTSEPVTTSESARQLAGVFYNAEKDVAKVAIDKIEQLEKSPFSTPTKKP